jgi:hypothetical protein
MIVRFIATELVPFPCVVLVGLVDESTADLSG